MLSQIGQRIITITGLMNYWEINLPRYTGREIISPLIIHFSQMKKFTNSLIKKGKPKIHQMH